MSVHHNFFQRLLESLILIFFQKIIYKNIPTLTFHLNLTTHLTPSLYLSHSTPGEDSLKNIPSARISCPKGSQAYGSYCYALFRIPQTWFDAEVSAGKEKVHKEHTEMLGSILPNSFHLRIADFKNNLSSCLPMSSSEV